MLPEQGEQSTSGDSDQGQPRVQWSPDKSAVTRHIWGQAGKSCQQEGDTNRHGQMQVSLRGGSGQDLAKGPWGKEGDKALICGFLGWTAKTDWRFWIVSQNTALPLQHSIT